MNVYTIEYAAPKGPSLKERKFKADDFAVHGDFVDFTTSSGAKVFSVRTDAVVTISSEPSTP